MDLSELSFIMKNLLGINPSNLWRRMIFGSVIVLLSGFISFGAIFYSFFYAFNTATLLCAVPDETVDIMSTFFTFPLIISALYMSLLAATIYYVNPWERLK